MRTGFFEMKYINCNSSMINVVPRWFIYGSSKHDQ